MTDDAKGAVDEGQGTAPTGDGGNTGGDGGDWRSNLPDSLVSAPYFRGADSLEAAIADITRAAETAGTSLRIPGPDASDEARAEFYDRIVEKAPGVMRKPDILDDTSVNAVLRDLGLPAEASEYTYEVDERLNMSDERVGELKAMAHEAGLTKNQFDKFMGKLTERDLGDLNAMIADRDKGLGELKGEWGAAYEQRMGKVAKVLDMIDAPDALREMFQEGQLSAADLRMFYNVADRLSGGEGGQVAGQGKSEPAPVLTPHEATLQLAELEHKLIGKNLPADQQQALMKRRFELMQLAHPDSSTDDSMLRRSIYGSR